jgi:hypothetical protein
VRCETRRAGPHRTNFEPRGPDGGPIVNQSEPDFSKLTLQEKLQLEGLLRKTEGIVQFGITFLP